MRYFILILLLFVIYSFPTNTNDKKGETGGKRRKRFNLDFYECINKNEEASQELKKFVEEHKDGQLRKYLITFKSNNENDQNVIKNCRKETFHKLRESINKTFQEISSGKHK